MFPPLSHLMECREFLALECFPLKLATGKQIFIPFPVGGARPYLIVWVCADHDSVVIGQQLIVWNN